MTREEAIEVLKNTEDNINYDKRRDEIYFTHEWVGAYEMAIAALRGQELLEKKQATSDWISVEERLPMIRKRVLVAYKAGVTIAEYRGYDVCKGRQQMYWCGCKGAKHVLNSVTHWMPLPDPPEED